MHVERKFTVARPVDAVFDYLADFTHTNDWDPGTVMTVRSSGDGGVGTTYANTSEFMGRQVDLVYETTAHERPRELKFRGVSSSATATDWLRLSPVDEGSTRIHYRADFEFGLLLRLVAPLVIGGRLRSLADETVERLTATLLART
jgi:carbon monoxide dehydrogenase subunit G